MNSIQDKSTEDKILDAAYEEFTEKGFDGSRMQSIASRAGINKALLHYYYRSKDKLFDKVFERTTQELPNYIEMIVSTDMDFEQKVRIIIEKYIDFIYQHPQIPSFIINELNRRPNNLANLIGKRLGVIEKKIPQKIDEMIKKEVESGNIREISVEDFIVNLLALCVFPFISRPIIANILFNNDKSKYNKFICSRKKEVADFFINAIKK